MKNTITLLLVISTFLLACNNSVSGIRKNESIAPELREELKKLDELVIQKIVAADSSGLISLCSEKMLAVSRKDVGMLIGTLHQYVHKNNFAAFNNYHSVNTIENGPVIISVDLSGPDGYTLRYTSVSKESYLSQYIVSDSVSTDYLLTIFYTKGKENWEVSLIQLSQYRICGKTAPRMLAEAQKNYADNNLVDAVNYAALMQIVATPANTAWQYQQEGDMKTFYTKVMREGNARYRFPVTLSGIKTAPKILRFYPGHSDKGIFTFVTYQSAIPLTDTNALKQEFREIRKETPAVIEGLNRDKKYVYYQAFNELAEGSPSFIFADTVQANNQ